MLLSSSAPLNGLIIRVPRSATTTASEDTDGVEHRRQDLLDLAYLTDIDTHQLPQVVLAARLYHLVHTHRAMVVSARTRMRV